MRLFFDIPLAVFSALCFLGSALMSTISLFKFGLPKNKVSLLFPAIDVFFATSILLIDALGWPFAWLHLLLLIPYGAYFLLRSWYHKKMCPEYYAAKKKKNRKEDENTHGD